jgi:integrase
MASISTDSTGRRRILFFLGGDRKQIRLGTMPPADAFNLRFEFLVDAVDNGRPIDLKTAKWIDSLPDKLAGKLAKAGLISPRDSDGGPTRVGAFVDRYVAGRNDVKAATRIVYGNVQRNLKGYFGSDKPLADVTAGDAKAFRRWLTTDQQLGENTVCKRIGIARQFFQDAVDRRLIDANPFAKAGSTVVRADKDRQYFVTRDETAKLLEACPDAQWRLLVALSRYGGLRTPSESLALKWGDVDWANGRMTVKSPKTAHHRGKASRVVPIFPELRPYLDEAFAEAEEGTVHVVTRYRKSGGANFGTHLSRLVMRAGLTAWPKLWHNMRSSRQTELAETFPSHVVCAWIGNSKAVADEHYLQVTEEHFARVLHGPEPGSKPKAAHKAAQYGVESGGMGGNPRKSAHEKTPVFQGYSVPLSFV